MARATFTIPIAFLCSAAGPTPRPVTFESWCYAAAFTTRGAGQILLKTQKFLSSYFQHLLIQIVYFYQSNSGDNVFAAHNPGVVTWWQGCDNRRLSSVPWSVAAAPDVAYRCVGLFLGSRSHGECASMVECKLPLPLLLLGEQ
jgi:hypothetical protein